MKVLAVLIVAAAASCINVGKALQKQGTKGLPRLVLDRKVLATYLNDKTWSQGREKRPSGIRAFVGSISHTQRRPSVTLNLAPYTSNLQPSSNV
jgi:hypothetical protein